jgi:molecular chaperone HtpG
MERHEFQAEVKQLLDLVVHSLYSNKDIFLRELVSNASDALDKLRFEQLTTEGLRSDSDPEIRIEVDIEKRTLSISDNGIGMSREEVVRNIGTIAKSGTKEFLAKITEKKADAPQLIGQFGVGFYSAFMVADTVRLVTRRAGEEKATLWMSTGDGSYSIDDADRKEHGTTVTLELKEKNEEAGIHDYTDEATIRGIIRRYSDFVSYPIKLGGLTLNSMKAIWARPKSEVTEQEYKEFYRHISHDWHEPLRHVSVKIEGNFEASALLFLPSKAPWDLFQAEMKRGVQLYVKRVFIMDECRELMPPWLRFVKGVVDAQDLSLNVSRELLQKNRQIQVIRKQLTKRVFDTIDDMRDNAREDLVKLWREFGPVIKEGLVPTDAADKDRILDVLLVPSTKDDGALTTLGEYVSRMKEGQEAIYYLSGASPEVIKSAPHLESFKEQGIEVLLFSDSIDELWLDRELGYKGKKLRSISKGEIAIGGEEAKKKAQEQLEEQQREYKDVLNAIRAVLQDEVKEVRLSQRLTTSLACLVRDEGDLSPQLERIMAQLGQPVPKAKPILELNGRHPVLPKLLKVCNEDKQSPIVEQYARLILGQAILSESGQLADPAAFGKLVAELMVRAI